MAGPEARFSVNGRKIDASFHALEARLTSQNFTVAMKGRANLASG